MAQMATITVIGLRLCVDTRLRRSPGRLVKLTKFENTRAPTRMTNSIAGGAGAVDQDVEQRPPVEGPAGQREHEGAEGADAGAFGGGEDAAVDAAHGEGEQGRHRPDLAQRLQSIAPARPFRRRPGLRVAPADVLHRDAEQDHGDEAGQEAGREQLADAGLGHDPVEDHDGRGRDQDAERAAGGDRAGGELVGVAVAVHRRVGDLGEGRGGGDRGAADRAEAGAGEHRRHRQAAAQVADEGVGGPVQLLRHAGPGDEVAHQDEERHHRQHVFEAGLVDHRRRRGHRRAEAAHPPRPRKPTRPIEMAIGTRRNESASMAARPISASVMTTAGRRAAPRPAAPRGPRRGPLGPWGQRTK